MFQRWRGAGILALALFALNVAGRWTAKLMKAENQAALDHKKDVAGLILIVAIGLVFVGLTVYWGRVRPFPRVAQDLGAATLAACLLAVFVGPLTVGESPFRNGAGAFFSQFLVWGGLAIGGTLLGYMGLVAFTSDYRSRQLKRFADRSKTLPKRVARR
ncbi:MAG TPA: hypothetical protein VFC19_48965 [Candidatus Limnocylindrales bacterium]|nr:hypothetical protein [Candidatus Limnocylindrales bacterium]